MTMTTHFKNDRADRYAFIATTIGLGEVIHSHTQVYSKQYKDPCIVEITTTGVAIVKAPSGAIVSMYILTLSEAQRYFETAVPLILSAIIRANMRKRLHILQNEVKY